MYLTPRARRRLRLLGTACIATLVLAIAAFAVRSVHQAKLVAAARDRGIAALQRGDHRAALPDLLLAANRSGDPDLLVMLANARANVHEERDRHLLMAAELYRDALTLAPRHVGALEGLLEVSGRLGWEREHAETADRLLRIDPDHRGAIAAQLAARIAALVRSATPELTPASMSITAPASAPEPVLAAVRRMQALEPASMEWPALELELRRRAGEDPAALLARCDELLSRAECGTEADPWRLLPVRIELLVALGQVEEARRLADAGVAHLLSSGRTTVGASDLARWADALDATGLWSDADGLVSRGLEARPDDRAMRLLAARRDWLADRVTSAIETLGVDQWEQGEPVRQGHPFEGDRSSPLAPTVIESMELACLLHALAGDASAVGASLDVLEASMSQVEPSRRHELTTWIAAMREVCGPDATSWRARRDAVSRALDARPRDAAMLYLAGRLSMEVRETELACRSYRQARLVTGGRWLRAGVAEVEALIALKRPHEAVAVALALRQLHGERPAASMALLEAWSSLESAGGDIASLEPELARRGLATVASTFAARPDAPAKSTELLARIHLLANDREAFDELVRSTLATPSASPGLLLALARLHPRPDAAPVDALLAQAERAGAAPLAVAEVKARGLVARGRPREGIALVQQAAHGADAAIRIASQRLVIEIAQRAGLPETAGYMRRFLERNEGGPSAAAWAVEQPTVWTDPSLARLAIDRLAEAIGADSPRSILADATWTLRYRPTDEGLARVTVRVNRLLAVLPDEPSVLRIMARLMVASSEPDLARAVEILRQSAQLEPGDADTDRVALALVLADQGAVTEAIEVLEPLATAARPSPSAVETMTALLTRDGRTEEARTLLQAWLERAQPPHDVAARIALARHQLHSNEAGSALTALEPCMEAIVADRFDRPEGLRVLIAASIATQTLPASLAAVFETDPFVFRRWLDVASEAAPLDAFAALERAGSVVRTPGDRLLVAHTWYAIARNGACDGADAEDNPQSRSPRDESHRCRAALEAAAAGAMQALREGAHAVEARLIAAAAVARLGRRTEAETLYREALVADPANLVATNNLATLLIADPDRSTEALALVDDALAEAPSHPDLLDTRALVLLSRADADGAAAAAAAAVRARPGDAALLLTQAKTAIARRDEAMARRLLADVVAASSGSRGTDRRLADTARALMGELR